MAVSGVATCGLVVIGLGTAQAAVAGSVVTVPCKVSALVAAVGDAGAGDTVSLASGCVYHLTAALPTVSEDLTIDGNGAMVERSYDPGTPAFTILTITSGAVTINDLEMRHGDNAITVSGSGPTITVNDCVFVNNRGTDGGAISDVTGVDGPVVSGSVFLDNKATDSGGAIYNNSALDGVVVTGSTFTGNIAAGDGGAVYDFSEGEKVTGSLIENNRASDGGGLLLLPNNGLLLSQDTISHNSATGDGGGIATDEFGDLTLQDSTIASNHAADGGGLYTSDGQTEEITDTDFLSNTARDGGGIFTSLVIVDEALTGTRLLDNKARADGGGVYYDSTGADESGATWSATDSQIIGNLAGKVGGGIFVTAPAAATVTKSRVRANKPTNCAPPGSVTGC
jgi:predicted outer membrane repeat protein